MSSAIDNALYDNIRSNAWLEELLGSSLPPEGERIRLENGIYVMRDGILRSKHLAACRA